MNPKTNSEIVTELTEMLECQPDDLIPVVRRFMVAQYVTKRRIDAMSSLLGHYESRMVGRNGGPR